MAPHDRRPDRTLAERLFTEGWRFDFYQAVRLLEMLTPEALPLAETSDATREAVRFIATVDFDFPPSDVHRIEPARTDADGKATPHRMAVGFMGMAGHHGVLPAPYAELVLDRIKNGDFALRDFLDIFNHRMISLLYRTRKIFRLGFDAAAPHQTRFAGYLYSLMGMGTDGLQGRMAVDDRAMLFYAGLIGQQPRSMTGLEAMLSHYFETPVRGRQLCGGWFHLSSDQITEVGAKGKNNRLGETVVLGRRVWDQQGRFELRLGPMDLERFLDFLPGRPGHVAIGQMVRFYAHDEFVVDLVLMLKPTAVPGAMLSAREGARLGWTSWVKMETGGGALPKEVTIGG